MSFVDTVTEKGREVAGKAKVWADIASLKSKVSGCESKIRKAYVEIGEKYYAEMGSDPGEAYVDACDAVRQAQAEIEELQEKIEALKAEA